MISHAYKVSTLGYGGIAVLSLFGIVFFLVKKDMFLALVCAAMLYVAIDNFFCSDRLCRAGGKAKGKYCVPPFLKGK